MNKNKKSSSLPMLIITVTAVLLITVGIVLAGDFYTPDKGQEEKPDIADETGNSTNDDDKAGEDDDKVIGKPPSANALLIGFDKSKGLTDVVMVAHLDTDTNEVKIINLPRDLMIDFREDGFDQIKKDNKLRIKYCKLTEVYSLAGWNEEALLVIKDIAEEITELKIDYTAAIDLDSFKNLVDTVGGVEFYVPERMWYHDDYQDLHIDLKEGLQLLDGDKAEQLVRNRKFKKSVPAPDKQRIMIQQKFLIAMTNKILKIRDFDQIKELASTAYDLVKTDFGYLVVAQYVDYLFNQDLTQLLSGDNMAIIPSSGKKVDGQWFEVWSREKAKETIDALFKEDILTDTESHKDDESKTTSSTEL